MICASMRRVSPSSASAVMLVAAAQNWQAIDTRDIGQIMRGDVAHRMSKYVYIVLPLAQQHQFRTYNHQ